MRTYNTLGQTNSRRTAVVFAVTLLTTIFMISASPLRADDPLPVNLVYFGATPMGMNQWFVDGVVEAEDMSAVTVTMGGAAIGIGTLSPDSYGYFAYDLAAHPYDDISANATDGATSSLRIVTLEDWY